MSTGLGDKALVLGHPPSLADIAVGCALATCDFRFPLIDWRGRHANLAKLAGSPRGRASSMPAAADALSVRIPEQRSDSDAVRRSRCSLR